MRPKKHETTGTNDLFRARLDQIINLKHELAQLAGKPNRHAVEYQSTRLTAWVFFTGD